MSAIGPLLFRFPSVEAITARRPLVASKFPADPELAAREALESRSGLLSWWPRDAPDVHPGHPRED